ncbi:MAG: zinc/iron-chelating domain-containing protein [Spirochaetaceae bacterium 4572_59]|nr:MAG: zinc/iron-chelating domain-containing protein [Spirochaetaceae bacterium 4572_59]
MNSEYQKLLEQAKTRYKENRKYFQKLKKMKAGKVDPIMASLHDEVFMEIDCLKCANCCRGTGPLLRERDISRLSKALRMRPGVFTEQYLQIDEDEDYIFKAMPCPFLEIDNYCSVYENRPGACRDYPHSNCISFKKYSSQMLENTRICPAVFLIFEKMKALIP